MYALVPVCVVIRSARHLASAECRWSTSPPLLQVMQCSWWASMGQAHVRLAALMFGHVGEMLAEWRAAGWTSMSRRANETWKHLSSAS